MAVQILTDPLTRFRVLDPRMTTLESVQESQEKLNPILKREIQGALPSFPPSVASLVAQYANYYFYPGTIGDILSRGNKDEIEMVGMVDRQGSGLFSDTKKFLTLFQRPHGSVTQRLFNMSVYSFRKGLAPGEVLIEALHIEQICSPILIPLCIRSCFLALTPGELKKFRVDSGKREDSDAVAIHEALERYQGEMLDRAFPL